MPPINVSFDLNQRRLQFSLDVDRQNPADASILDFIERGRLYEADISLFLSRVLEPGDWFVDVGANVGFFTIFGAALVGPGGRVIAFEPGENNLPRLRRNIDINGFKHVDIDVRPVSDTAKPVTLFLNEDNGGGNALWDVAIQDNCPLTKLSRATVALEATTLDALAASLPPAVQIKCLKIDIEGAEMAALAGARQFLRRHRVPFIVCEIFDFALAQMGSSQAALRALMRDYGYDTWVLMHDGSLPKFLPPGTVLTAPFIRNLLFARPDMVGPYFPVEHVEHDTRALVGPGAAG